MIKRKANKTFLFFEKLSARNVCRADGCREKVQGHQNRKLFFTNTQNMAVL